MRMRQVEQTKQRLTGKTIESVELDTGWSDGTTRSPMVLRFKEGGELKITPHKYHMDVEVKGVPWNEQKSGGTVSAE